MTGTFQRTLLAATSFVAVSAATTLAWADDAPAPSLFARDNNISVLERPRPDYEALGIHAGGFIVYPRLTESAVYDDNIFATSGGFQKSDEIFQTSPELAVKSNWSRHELNFLAHGVFNNYLTHHNEDTTDYGVAIDGRLDVVRRSNLFGGASYDLLTEARTDPNAPRAAAKPIVYNLGQVNFGGVHEINRLRLKGVVTYSDYSYQNNTTTSGTFLRQDDRDYGQTTELARGDYAVSPDTAIFLSATANQVVYRRQPPVAQFDRNSNGYDVDVGANFDITHLIRGEVQVGYLSQSYSQAGFKPVSGLSFKALVNWFPSELTTVNLKGSRTVQQPVDISASGYISTNVGVSVDHELLRNVILSASTSYTQNAYQGAPRKDDLTSAGVSGTYLLNRNIGLRLRYDYLQLDSSGADHINSYKDNRVTGGLTLQF
jgi:hypothetical protein